MTGAEADNLSVEKLVRQAEAIKAKQVAKKKVDKKLTKGRIRPHYVSGKAYYYYCHVGKPEIYLGSAEAILAAMGGIKVHTGSEQ